MKECLFCQKKDYILENDYAYAIFDEFPVSQGHMLIIPKKHVSHFFEADQELRTYLFALIDQAKQLLDEKYHPTGYNIGMNCGQDAGQSIMHLHIHLIPRYHGDTAHPKGGVRGVIPEKMNY
ncbi:HIT family protein [Allocoprobacillus halotolerans]|uniref:HIT family protein n=1 Tax=Allocoprobacillus halotolerans TaxID=2944914 RepID=A0ABY5I143_9FIRM|nr:HIT family protein [Allocoprobacillus halotolerans]UTY38418.1 HIT family protein [Allocoprobacillus halotolerans]